MEGLSIGRVVHFVTHREDDNVVERPAIVTEVLDLEKGVVHLQVFKGPHDGAGEPIDPETGDVVSAAVKHDPEKRAFTWHWPERA